MVALGELAAEFAAGLSFVFAVDAGGDDLRAGADRGLHELADLLLALRTAVDAASERWC